MAKTEWIEAIKSLTKAAFDAQSDGWKEFQAAIKHERAQDVAYGRWTPTREYAYCLFKHIRLTSLLPDIDPVCDEDGIYIQFERIVFPSGIPFLVDMAINESSVTRATNYAGNYRLIMAGDAGYAVYYCLLEKVLGPDGTPQFIMWRETDNERRTFRGAYFVNDERLYLVAGRRGSVDLRMFIFRINVGEEDSDYHGLSLFVSSGADITAGKSFLEVMRKPRAAGEVMPKVRRLVTSEELKEISLPAHQYLATENNAIIVSPLIHY